MTIKLLYKALVVVLISSLILSESLFATDYLKIINHVNKTPTKVVNSTYELSTYLCQPFNNESDKFAAIYYWVAKNITYNYSFAAQTLYYENTDEIVNYAMQNKDGVCQHYSELVVRLCQHAGLTAFVVGGYTQTDGKIDELSHAWNIIKVNGNWYFLDATWAGAIIQEHKTKEFPEEFFMISPKENIKTRMPFDPIWQALSEPLKYHEFDQGLFYHLKNGAYNYNDSILNYLKLNQTEQYQAKVRRIKSNGVHNKIVKKEYALMKENYKMLLYNLEVDKYNAASAYYNKGMRFYNEYVRLKNNKNTYLKKTKKQLLAIIDSSTLNLDEAQKLILKIKGDAEMQSHIVKHKKTITEVKDIMLKERQLVEKHF